MNDTKITIISLFRLLDQTYKPRFYLWRNEQPIVFLRAFNLFSFLFFSYLFLSEAKILLQPLPTLHASLRIFSRHTRARVDQTHIEKLHTHPSFIVAVLY